MNRRLRAWGKAAAKAAKHGVRLGALGSCVWGASACHDIDTTRVAPPKASLGDDIYGLFCDRVGASSFTEDLTGNVYQAVCHYDKQGNYSDKLDLSKLPPPAKGAEDARAKSIAKLQAMANHRSDLIRALNAAFPDGKIGSGKDQIRVHDALMDFAQRLAPLYETNPYAVTEPLLPSSTRSLGRLFDALGGHDAPRDAADPSQGALDALQSIGGRRGYRPFNVALGAIRPALAYPELRKLTQASLKVLGPGGAAAPELQALLSAVKGELATAQSNVSGLSKLEVDDFRLQPNRPRSNIEILKEVLLMEHASFGAVGEPSRFIAKRDARGFVSPLGGVSSPFVDKDSDGLADIDLFGRFVDGAGGPLKVASPFLVAGEKGGKVDAFGRSLDTSYTYIDSSQTLLSALARNFVPLLDAANYGGTGADAWKSENETIMYAMAGSFMLYGPREDAQFDYAADLAGENAIRGADEACSGCLKYKRFRGDISPFADLAHAAGQLLADKDSDVILASFVDLMESHEQTMARLIGAALKVREISAKYDEARMPYETPIWDEMAKLMEQIVQKPNLTRDLIAALADPTTVSQQGDSRHVGDTMAHFFTHKDYLTYHPGDVNGPAYNTTDDSYSDPVTPTDPGLQKTGSNRSIMQRSFQVIHDANRATLCNKAGGYVVIDAPVIGHVSWPLAGAAYTECELLRIRNQATFYIGSLLPDWHPKRSSIELDSGTALADLIGYGEDLGIDPNPLFEDSAGITGMTLTPTPTALNRLLFFGAASDLYDNMFDLDPNYQAETGNFIYNLIEPVSPVHCPKDGNGVEHCASFDETYRTRDYGTMFVWERRGFYDYLQPIVLAFANSACNEAMTFCDTTDRSGEQIFVDVMDILNRHWPGAEHGSECDGSGSANTNLHYCSGAGVNTYESLLGDALGKTDLIPALHEFADTVTTLSFVSVNRGPNAGDIMSGAEVLEKMTRILFDSQYAKQVGMKDRHGKSDTTWTDGTYQPQLTLFTLFADALHGMDKRFETACADVAKSEKKACTAEMAQRQGQWKRARSQLVDRFFAVDGEGANAQFRNPATPKAFLKILRVLREQVNANCPNREAGTPCTWGKTTMGKKVADTLSGPLFAGIMDVQEKVRADEDARRELEKLLSFILQASSQDDAFQGTLASFADILQIVSDDGHFAPLFSAASTAASPGNDANGAGVADTTVKVLKALTSDEYDRYHVLDTVLPALVRPIGGSGPTPIEVIMDTIADVNRIDADSEKPMSAEDYRAVWKTMNDFMTSETRGLEQFYFIVQKRQHE